MLTSTTKGHTGNLHRQWYSSDAVVQAAYSLSESAESHGLTGHSVSLRWLLHHSQLRGRHGDGIIIGGSSLEQVDDNMKACTAGPLPGELVRVVSDVWQAAQIDPPPAWV